MRSPLNIQITVRGRLSDCLAETFDGMTLVRCNGASELTGDVADYAQLHSVLTRIRDLGLEFESVHVLSTPERSL